MVEITSLPVDILTMIMAIVATYGNGPRYLAWISATCKEFKKVAKQPCVLKLLNFHCSGCILDYRKHRHPKDILFLCARLGNPIAESTFGLGLLHGDPWCWLMIFLNSRPSRDENGSIVSGPLQHRRLVRSFIRHGRSVPISEIFFPLRRYMISNAGPEQFYAHLAAEAIGDMCSYENTRYNTYMGIPKYLVLGDMPRVRVLNLYDKLIHSTPF